VVLVGGGNFLGNFGSDKLGFVAEFWWSLVVAEFWKRREEKET